MIVRHIHMSLLDREVSVILVTPSRGGVGKVKLSPMIPGEGYYHDNYHKSASFSVLQGMID